MPSFIQNWPLHAALLLTFNCSLTWLNLVSKEVPEPYLDEFFHVPQAQKYCDGDYTWDPKITTPPGLYIVAKLFKPLLGCSTASLRALNIAAICLICLVSYSILRTLRTPRSQNAPLNVKDGDKEPDLNDSTLILDANTALNIALFPPLFFFSALFYTDVMSTLVVLVSFHMFLKRSTFGNLLQSIGTIFLGLVALSFRQTNIFWVAVFPAGLAVIDALKARAPSSTSKKPHIVGDILRESWNNGVVHDCALKNASLQDYGLLVVTVAIAAMRSPVLVLQVASPYLVLLVLFASFVIWNGSVVLGDKSAHTATIHLPQMLYIWPYIAFFSAPLVVGPMARPAVMLLPKQFQALFERYHITPTTSKFPEILSVGLFILGAFLAVHFNTIIHPYTLADNRHYVFYVFRILRRHPAIRYLAVPAYYACAWLVTNAVGASPDDEQPLKQKRENGHPTNIKTGRTPCQISFFTIWLAATALSVVTAPLVEPRYFIIPWIIWRLHVPSASASLSSKERCIRSWYDLRLGLETLWLLVVDVAVTYIFLYRGFEWPSEPGKLQRFLW
ncbi:alpha-1,2-glucosyltransferase [Parastagonospora nodorum]|nr:alpha-1,2-glucosyltransferase [Parastagonospora nodorum]KAH4439166.1 alpha-1,2-glucosyltransferase [Parastagonospora nodorum]KAH4445177.1 alpha-1,2-glucosyltransferase [Parastagonospora nodorum]KAH4492890.1 alpha-1,2-glucosyltransferase [Parastagonospora nodorum]KAH4545721.1 alpha-1,2-glucosyltransferase [Parastagonospora nodorum]